MSPQHRRISYADWSYIYYHIIIASRSKRPRWTPFPIPNVRCALKTLQIAWKYGANTNSTLRCLATTRRFPQLVKYLIVALESIKTGYDLAL